MEEKLSRNAFLKSLGFKGASLLAVYCAVPALSSCINEPSPNDPGGGGSTIDFTLDLNDSAYSALKTVGKYVIANRIVIARISSTTFAAVTQVCSHENKAKVIYRNAEFYCPEHGAKYDVNGRGLNSNGKNGLTVYMTAFDGSLLRVFS
ncbi:Rieske 2Fe-2S domain-containing protein [Algoriphagus marinus]|uniref:Rieske 2Fe-2S domain-containing protein n=1 Tax=Algoriphagus marinus TaxID=1925762 RepID=UPI00094B87CB|nr:Rieske 2Fe-2S domain-containing protein [Algoriphagus marinus]